MKFTLVTDGSSDRKLLITASELKGRHQRRFRPGQQAIRLGELIGGYELLRRLPAFRALEKELAITLENSGIA